MNVDKPEWMEDAACIDMPLDVFCIITMRMNITMMKYVYIS